MENQKPLYKVIIQQECRIILVTMLEYKFDDRKFRGKQLIHCKCEKEIIFSIKENDTLDFNGKWVTFTYENIFESREDAENFIRKKYHLMLDHIVNMFQICENERDFFREKIKGIDKAEEKMFLDKVKITQFFENF